MAADLVKHGIVERKSMVLKPPNIQQELMRHWIRGYFDGDGSVHRSMVGNLQGDMVGTLEVMDFILSHCSILRGPYKKGNQYAVRFGGNRRAKHLYDYLYNDSNVCLTRKKQIFEKKREV